MVRIFSITALLLAMVLFGGSIFGSPAFAMTPDGLSIDLTASDHSEKDLADLTFKVADLSSCGDCTVSDDVQAVCGGACIVSGLAHKNDFPVSSHKNVKGERFDYVTFDLLGRAESPEPHPPKTTS